MPLWIAATLAAFFVKGLCGFANTLVFTSVLSFGVSNAGISPVELLLGLPTNAILAWRERRSLDLSLCLPLAALVLLGCVPGALFLRNADTRLVKLAFGVLIIVLFAQETRRTGDRVFRFMPLAVGLSFGFYLPVVLFSGVVPAVGMLMIPKTMAYVWIVLMCRKLYIQERSN